MLACLIWTPTCEHVWLPLGAAVSASRLPCRSPMTESVSAETLLCCCCDLGKKYPAKEREKNRDKAVFCVGFNIGWKLISKSNVKARRAGGRQAR